MVKAWSEAYGRPIAAVSRVEALASQAEEGAGAVAVFANAHREQIFGAFYRRKEQKWERVEDEMVIAPAKFVEWVSERAGVERVSWVSPDPEHITQQENWRERERRGERVQVVSAVLAPVIGRIGCERVLENRLADAVTLDANYVRRSDAELLWKGGRSRGGEGEAVSKLARVRAVRPEGIPELVSITEESSPAASLSKESYEKLCTSEGFLAFVSERAGSVSGFVVGRHA